MADLNKEEIEAKLEEAGIEFDGRWSAERLAALLPGEKQAESKADGVEVIVGRDYWDEDGNRMRKGRVVTVSVEDALAGIESGALKRVK